MTTNKPVEKNDPKVENTSMGLVALLYLITLSAEYPNIISSQKATETTGKDDFSRQIGF
ncbi:hypothetical protein FALCPG4_013768 [Fusarium falciforme]